MIRFNCSAIQHCRTYDWSWTIKSEVDVIGRVLKKYAFCQIFLDHFHTETNRGVEAFFKAEPLTSTITTKIV